MNAPQPTSLVNSLTQARAALLAGRAATAEKLLRAQAAQHAADPNLQWLLAGALLYQEQPAAARELLETLLQRAPQFIEARVDLARALRAEGRPQEAREQVRRVLEKHPRHHRAWMAYGDLLVELENFTDARIAFERARETDPERPAIERATAALAADDRRSSEEIFRQILQRDPSHVAALVGLAAASLAAETPRDAERLLRHALKQSASLPLIWRALGPTLMRLGQVDAADQAARRLLRIEPDNPQSWVTLASVATRNLRVEDALEAYEQAARLQPQEVGLRMSIGHTQKTLGRRADSEASYHRALELDPGHAEAYWSLADLKNYTFADAEIEQLRRLVRDDPRRPSNEAQLHFALGKALEQRGRYGESFLSYARGNALRRIDEPFSIEAFERRTQRIRAFFTAEYFRARAQAGNPSRAPIFIVGLPRSGSTLIEQILASHSQVEGTMELPNIINLAYELDDRVATRDGYPDTMQALSAAQLGALGARYLEETAPLRLGLPHFTDKLPNNFNHIGLIHSILPNAILIDARRHPMDSCFSTFKQHFAKGQAFSYDLGDLGRYYRCYLDLMEHWDQVIPGKVLCVQYEDMVRDPESTIRRLLAFAGLPFEPACLNFHETKRAVRTASAEQVRQPIYSSSLGYWQHFERELEPLRRALGDAVERFRPGG
ncbi:MAG TPA: sulfotransferase [Steroidobacteraceae bacterium]|jgi:cytochrome c-type biogenesis protein CcmH/NrfG